MSDLVMRDWLAHEHAEVMQFSARSDVVKVAPIEGDPPFKYLVQLRCKGLAHANDRIRVVDHHVFGVRFPEDYLRVGCHPARLVTWLEPITEFAPNIRAPLCCIGPVAPGMGLLNVIYQVHSMVTWQRFTAREDDALNQTACLWARQNMDRLPIDRSRSLIRREIDEQR